MPFAAVARHGTGERDATPFGAAIPVVRHIGTAGRVIADHYDGDI
jgi:hypothetical protein